MIWKPLAVEDRSAVFDYIAADNPRAAIEMDGRFDQLSRQLIEAPRSGRIGRVRGTYELIAHPNYLFIYKVLADEVWILRLLHSAQKWP